MDPRPLKYVAPTSTEEELAYAPEPVVIYDLPSGGGGGGGAVNSVNGKTGTVVLTPSDIGAAANSDVAEFAANVQTSLTNLDNDLDTKAATTYVDNQLATKASATDLDNVFGIATNAQTLATDAVPKTRTVAGKPLSADITLDKVDVNLSNVDNTADSAKPVSTAQQTALNLKANLASPTFTGTVGGITKSMVGLGSVDNTSDANKPVSTATQTALDAKVPTSRTVAGRALTADVPRAALNTLGLGEAIFIPKNGTVPGGTPTYTIVIEAEA